MEQHANLIGKVANISARRRWIVFAVWAGILVLGLMFAGTIDDVYGKTQ